MTKAEIMRPAAPPPVYRDRTSQNAIGKTVGSARGLTQVMRLNACAAVLSDMPSRLSEPRGLASVPYLFSTRGVVPRRHSTQDYKSSPSQCPGGPYKIRIGQVIPLIRVLSQRQTRARCLGRPSEADVLQRRDSLFVIRTRNVPACTALGPGPRCVQPYRYPLLCHPGFSSTTSDRYPIPRLLTAFRKRRPREAHCAGRQDSEIRQKCRKVGAQMAPVVAASPRSTFNAECRDSNMPRTTEAPSPHAFRQPRCATLTGPPTRHEPP